MSSAAFAQVLAEARFISYSGLLPVLRDAARPKRTSLEIINFLMRARKDPHKPGMPSSHQNSPDPHQPLSNRTAKTSLQERESSAFHFDYKKSKELRKDYYPV
jgi:hypothetical protein